MLFSPVLILHRKWIICVGAELFAKRRKKSEKWVVDETTVKTASSSAITTEMISTSSTLTQQQHGSKLPPLPTYLDESTKRVEVMHKLNEIQVYWVIHNCTVHVASVTVWQKDCIVRWHNHKNNTKQMRQKATMPILRYYHNVHLKRFKLAMKNLYVRMTMHLWLVNKGETK